tara:strand:+ start:223 stop:648 length:426 start_codon:yes stop_codon:yes gene_type:complete
MKRFTAKKMSCVECGHDRTRVACGSFGPDGITKRRYRKCPNCGATFRTLQIVDVEVGPEVRVPYMTQQEKVEHRRERSRASGQVKLTAEEVGEIRYLHKHAVFRPVDIAAQYGISRHHVSELAHNKRLWKEVEIPKTLVWM